MPRFKTTITGEEGTIVTVEEDRDDAATAANDALRFIEDVKGFTAKGTSVDNLDD